MSKTRSSKVADRYLEASHSREARNPPFHEAAAADEALGKAYRSLVDLKLGFDSWHEIPASAMPLYKSVMKAMDAVAKARHETTQVREMVKRKRYGSDQALASRVADRKLASEAREVSKLYLHLHNGGATLKVIDAGSGPEFVAEINSFGKMDARVHLQTDVEGLRRIADMLHIAAGHDGFSTHWDDGLTPTHIDDDLSIFRDEELFASMAASVARWIERRKAEGIDEATTEELVDQWATQFRKALDERLNFF